MSLALMILKMFTSLLKCLKPTLLKEILLLPAFGVSSYKSSAYVDIYISEPYMSHGNIIIKKIGKCLQMKWSEAIFCQI